MNKKTTISILAVCLLVCTYFYINQNKEVSVASLKLKIEKEEKSLSEKMRNAEERELHELAFQINPNTGKIPVKEKINEYEEALIQQETSRRSNTNTYISRGPSNLGGRTRAVIVDLSDSSGKTLIAGGVSSGVFKSVNGGESWTKVSSNSEIHNVTTIAQDPRPGFQNIWYYGTGERRGNSASLGSAFRGQGVWKSTDNGDTWSQMPGTDSSFITFDSPFDYVNKIEVSPLNGDVFIATIGKIYRYDGTNYNIELESNSGIQNIWTDVVIAKNGRVFAAVEGNSAVGGVHTSTNGNGSWTRIAQSGTPTGWRANGRIVLGIAPSNNDVIYALYDNRQNGIEADLWKYNHSTTTWTDYSSKLPDEPNGDSDGNDPFAIQGGYDLVVAVKPNDENHVLIGGTNAYEIDDITNDNMFTRIGGYRNNQGYALYDAGGRQHHPDIHSFAFDNNNSDFMYTGTDGGVHKTDLFNQIKIWFNLNNNYLTYQYYHVALDPAKGSDIVIGGAQDNGTTLGGTDAGLSDKSSMQSIAGGDGVAVALGEAQLAGLPILFLGTQRGPIYRRVSGYTEITPDNSSSQFVTYFYLDPDNTNALYYAGNNKLYLTDDANNVESDGWTDAGFLPSGENIRSFATTRGSYDVNNSYLYIGGSRGGVFRLKDPQNATKASDASSITPSGANTNDGSIVSGIATHPTDKDIVLVTYANYGINNIYLTTNATAEIPTWTLVERNLDDHSIRSAAIAEVNGETQYFVGTARGLYKSTDPTTNDWALEGSQTIGLAVVSGLVYRPSDNTLLVGTHGNGMFETTLTSTLSIEDNNNVVVAMYPNPTQYHLKFVSNSFTLNDDTKYAIYSIKGAKIGEGKLSNNAINVASLSAGVYMVNLKSDGKTISKKFVKN